MKIDLFRLEPVTNAIEKELQFTFIVSDIQKDEIPQSIQGYVESNGKKIGVLNESNRMNQIKLNLNANSYHNSGRENYQFYISFTLSLNGKTINYLENQRHSKDLKEVNFRIFLNVNILQANMRISCLHLDEMIRQRTHLSEEYSIKYKYVHDHKPQRTDLWILSGNESPTFIESNWNKTMSIDVSIEMMKWIKEFVPYLELGNILVLELQQPGKISGSKKLADRYVKAQSALDDMKKQLEYGEWKQAIISSRPIFELFKNFDEFKKLVIDSGYSEGAYNDLKNSINGFFGLQSKFYHGLQQHTSDVNPDIEIQREDANFAYSYSVMLLHLISQKTKRLN